MPTSNQKPKRVTQWVRVRAGAGRRTHWQPDGRDVRCWAAGLLGCWAGCSLGVGWSGALGKSKTTGVQGISKSAAPPRLCSPQLPTTPPAQRTAQPGGRCWAGQPEGWRWPGPEPGKARGGRRLALGRALPSGTWRRGLDSSRCCGYQRTARATLSERNRPAFRPCRWPPRRRPPPRKASGPRIGWRPGRWGSSHRSLTPSAARRRGAAGPGRRPQGAGRFWQGGTVWGQA